MSLFRRNLVICLCVLAATTYAVYHVHAQSAPATPAPANTPAVVGVATNPSGSCTMNGQFTAPVFQTVNLSTGVTSRCVGGTWATDTFTSAGGTFNVNGVQQVDATGALNSNVAGESPVYSVYGNITTANINAGTTVIVPATASRTIKVLHFLKQALGGSAATCTAVQMLDTSAVVAVSSPIANLTANTIVTEATASETLTTFLTGLTAGAGIKINQTGSACATMTSMNYAIFYTYQ
jgi:hypothetical protein